MSLLSSIGHFHIQNIEESKALTAEKQVVKIENDFVKNVYIPEVDPKTMPLDLKVKIGDEVKVGTVIGIRKDFSIPVYSSVSGKIVGEEMLFHATAGRPTKHFVIENDFKYEKAEGLKPLGEDCTSEEIVSRLQEAAIVGFGGAGFPTYIKYKGVKDIDTVLINGVECEPYLTTDYREMQNERELLLEGASLLVKAAHAKKAIIVFKNDKPALLAKLNEILGNYKNVEIKTVIDAYPMGWEKSIVKMVLHRNYNRLPSEAHCIVNNAQTAIAAAKAIKYGEVTTSRVITVTGNAVKEPKNVLAPIGTKVSELIRFCNGYSKENVVLLLGGPMTSTGKMNDNIALLPQNSGVTVLERLVLPQEPCLRCGACTDHCPAGLQPVEIKQAVEMKDVDRMMALDVMKCVSCGLCSYICPSKIEVSDFVAKAKLQVNIAIRKKQALEMAQKLKK